MMLVVQILGAIGGMCVLIAGFIGATPFVRLSFPEGGNLTTAQMTEWVRASKCWLAWSLSLFGVGGVFLFVAFLVFASTL